MPARHHMEVTCPVCAAAEIESVLKILDVPTTVAVLYDTAEAARAAPRGDVALVLCRRCSYVWNAAFDPSRLNFAAGYDASLHHSPTYARFLEETADRLSARFGLAGKRVAEVGSGSGYFLRLLCRRAGCDGVGIDPAGPGGVEEVAGRRIRFVREPLSGRHAAVDAALVMSRQVFHYATDPVAFARTMAQLGTALYVEVPSGDYVFARSAAWSIYYEHVGYYSPVALARTLSEAGLTVAEVSPCYEDGQYLYAGAQSKTGYGSPTDTSRYTAQPAYLNAVRAFSDAYHRSVVRWRDRLASVGGRVVVWGAAGRGTTFCNVADADGSVVAVVDSNPARQGTFIAGTAQPVIGPEALGDLRPDLVVLTNPTYEAEIRTQTASLGLSPTFAAA